MKSRTPYVFDLSLPLGFHLTCPELDNTTPVRPISLATVPARITYTRTGRLRVSFGGQVVIDRTATEPSGELFNLGKLDRLMEASGLKGLMLASNLTIKAKGNTNG